MLTINLEIKSKLSMTNSKNGNFVIRTYFRQWQTRTTYGVIQSSWRCRSWFA